jgi:hypothetical protein
MKTLLIDSSFLGLETDLTSYQAKAEKVLAEQAELLHFNLTGKNLSRFLPLLFKAYNGVLPKLCLEVDESFLSEICFWAQVEGALKYAPVLFVTPGNSVKKLLTPFIHDGEEKVASALPPCPDLFLKGRDESLRRELRERYQLKGHVKWIGGTLDESFPWPQFEKEENLVVAGDFQDAGSLPFTSFQHFAQSNKEALVLPCLSEQHFFELAHLSDEFINLGTPFKMGHEARWAKHLGLKLTLSPWGRHLDIEEEVKGETLLNQEFAPFDRFTGPFHELVRAHHRCPKRPFHEVWQKAKANALYGECFEL